MTGRSAAALLVCSRLSDASVGCAGEWLGHWRLLGLSLSGRTTAIVGNSNCGFREGLVLSSTRGSNAKGFDAEAV
jgi:hypothetical protein